MISEDIKQAAQAWMTPTFDQDTQSEIKELLENDEDQLTERFYKNLEFGTGGMRGVMGAGTNRINKYTLGKATQGLSNYLKQTHGDKTLKVAIGYDCRNNSDTLAKLVADVFTANGIKVYLFEELRPTPELSFAVRHFGCDAGIVLTASHNPPEYNGYKVYWNDGGQIVPPEDHEIIAEVNRLGFDQIKFDGNDNLITYIGKDVDREFIKGSIENTLGDVKGRDQLKVVFTSIHGTSIKLIPDTLAQAGYSDVHIVEEQREPDGTFPTVVSPNPEEPEALSMAVALANDIDADIVLGTDPDSDRIGVAVRNMQGEMILLNGNQTMAMMTDFLVKKWVQEGRVNGNQFVGSTIVSTNLVDRICEAQNVQIKIGLTGFKWIAKMIRDYKDLDFIGGGEESFGYMVGDFVRDKDAVSAGLLACEIAADAKSKGSSFYEELLKVYTEHGFYKEHLIALVKKGMDGAQLIADMMVELRNNPLESIDGSKVARICDYQSGVEKNMLTGEETQIDIPKSNVLIYHTEDGSKIAARPSGTEPKIKFYFSVNAPLATIEEASKVEAELDAKIERIIEQMKLN
ncbi:MAG: phospho-sugar mutase [Flavobacteriaceae bacterium]